MTRFMKTIAQTIDDVLRHEDSQLTGICTDIPDDKGGKTKYGITQATWNAFRLKAAIPDLPPSVCDISLVQARSFYEREYVSRFAKVADSHVKAALVDWNVNSGYAIRTLRRTLTALKGARFSAPEATKMDDELATYLNEMQVDQALAIIAVARLFHYYLLAKADTSQLKFIGGWFNRALSSSNIGALANDTKWLRGLGFVAGLMLRSLSLPLRLTLAFTKTQAEKDAIGGGLSA